MVDLDQIAFAEIRFVLLDFKAEDAAAVTDVFEGKVGDAAT